jgi:hypothetical protein
MNFAKARSFEAACHSWLGSIDEGFDYSMRAKQVGNAQASADAMSAMGKYLIRIASNSDSSAS